MKPIKKLKGKRWLIWAVVSVVVILGSLSAYIYVSAINQNLDLDLSWITHRNPPIQKSNNFQAIVTSPPQFAIPNDWKHYTFNGFDFFYPKTWTLDKYQDLTFKTTSGTQASLYMSPNYYSDPIAQSSNNKINVPMGDTTINEIPVYLCEVGKPCGISIYYGSPESINNGIGFLAYIPDGTLATQDNADVTPEIYSKYQKDINVIREVIGSQKTVINY